MRTRIRRKEAVQRRSRWRPGGRSNPAGPCRGEGAALTPAAALGQRGEQSPMLSGQSCPAEVLAGGSVTTGAWDPRIVGPQDHPSSSASTAATGRNRSRVYAPGGAPSASGWTVSRPTRILPSRLDVFAGGADPSQAPSASVSKERQGRRPTVAPSLGLVVRALLSNGAAVSRRRRRLHKRWRVMRRTRSRLRRNLTDPHWARPHRLQARGPGVEPRRRLPRPFP